MKILHTSDIHLVQFNDDRWKALLKIIDVAKKENIDVMVISGDLFDKSSNAELLKNEIRKIFSDNSFRIILIPGNHDYKAFDRGVFFGKDVIWKNSDNSPVFSFKDIDIWTLPFEAIGEAEILKKLKKLSMRIDRKKINILLYHGELNDSFYNGGDYGEEGESSYMPVKLSYFENLGFQYILAGHFHKNFEIKNPYKNVYFVYSGSPISITKREIGRRVVDLFEVGNPPQEYEIDTPYYEFKEIKIDPFDNRDPISMIFEKLKNNNPYRRLILKVKGYINASKLGYGEKDFYNKLEKGMPEHVVEKSIEINDISRILDNELYKEFYESVKRINIDSKDKKELIDIVMNAFIRLE